MTEIPDGQCISMNAGAKRNVPVSSAFANAKDGKSVEYAPAAAPLHWFPIRATYHRAQKVYDRLVELNDGRYEPYLPTLCSVDCTDGGKAGHPEPQVRTEPLDKGLLFVRASLPDYRRLLEVASQVPGLTPYYNHFATNEFGRNELLIVPDRQMESFRIIVESRNHDILVNQTQVPSLIEGDHVVVTGGAFAGVEGIVMKYRHQKRVFVQLQGVGTYATAYVPSAFLKLKTEN